MLAKIWRNLIRRLKGELTLAGDVTLKAMVKEGLTVGRNLHLGPGVRIDPSHYWQIEIGDDVILAPNVLILAHDASTRPVVGYSRIGRVCIGDRVFIGAGAIILPDVTIGVASIIGAGSVVSRDVPPGVIVAGNPAQVVGTVEDYAAKHHQAMKQRPCFDERYTLRRKLTPAMKAEMNQALADGPGYVV